MLACFSFIFSSRRRHTISKRDWSSDVCSSDLIPPYEIKKVITVCKAYSSAVGAGAFVSEIFGEEADELRRRGGDGGEYGATTGRSEERRVGRECRARGWGYSGTKKWDENN